MAWQSGALERLRRFSSLDVLLRTLMLHVARGYSLRETVLRAKLADWTDISDVALLKRFRHSEEWLRLFCIELLRETVAYQLEEDITRTIRIALSSESQARRGANGEFCIASDYRVSCVIFSR